MMASTVEVRKDIEIPAGAPTLATPASGPNGPALGIAAPPPDRKKGLAGGFIAFWKMFKRHWIDWIVLAVLLAGWLVLSTVPDPSHRYADAVYFANNTHYPIHKDTIGNGVLFVICLVAPLVLISLRFVVRRSVADLHNAILGLLYSLLFTLIINAYTKVVAGALRPDFFYRCWPDGNAVFLANGDVLCTQTDKSIVKDGRMSFFSGHAAATAAGLGFLAWYMIGKSRSGDQKGHASRLILPIMSLSGAFLVGISRYTDYKHRFVDVLVGFAIGLLISYACYRHFYPSFNYPRAQDPYEDANGIRREFVHEIPEADRHSLPV